MSQDDTARTDPNPRYLVTLTAENEGRFHAKVPAIPGCSTQGTGVEQTLTRVTEVIDIIQETQDTEIGQLLVTFDFPEES